MCVRPQPVRGRANATCCLLLADAVHAACWLLCACRWCCGPVLGSRACQTWVATSGGWSSCGAAWAGSRWVHRDGCTAR